MNNIDLLFPTATPSRAVVKAWRKVPGQADIPVERVNAILRNTALHEAAHAVAHDRFGHALHFATICPAGESAGQVGYLIDSSNHSDNLARAALAAPIADLMCALIHGCPVTELRLPDDDGDVESAVRVKDYAGVHLMDLIVETTTFVSQPRVWGTMVIVADALLKRGRFEGGALHQLIAQARAEAAHRLSFPQEHVLTAARNELLRLDDRPYLRALWTTLKSRPASVPMEATVPTAPRGVGPEPVADWTW